ncbi:hypothetical protein ACFQV4_12760 [Streptomyces thermocarboxydus]
MLNAAERPLIVAGGGVVNADAADLLVRFAELTGTPVVPTLMGWGVIPDDHELNSRHGRVADLHRYGNATFLESDFVLGIGNRWANRHTGRLDVYTAGRTFVHVDVEPTQIGRIFAPTTASPPTRAPRWNSSSRSRRRCGRRAASPTAPPGRPPRRNGAPRCSAVRTSTTCR